MTNPSDAANTLLNVLQSWRRRLPATDRLRPNALKLPGPGSWRSLRRWLPDWRRTMGALFAAIALHIATTFATPSLVRGSAFERLAPALPLNTMTVLPVITPERQPLPFQGSDVRLAVCSFDTSVASIAVSAPLPGPGWSLVIQDDQGATLYSALGQLERNIEVAVMLVADDARFTGLTPEALGRRSPAEQRLRVEATRGLAVVRAPDSGLAYRGRVEAVLRQASCAPNSAP